MKRGEIWWASMKEPRGSEPGYQRPVVIVSSNEFNQSLIQTVIVAVVTSNLRLAYVPGNFKITKKHSALHIHVLCRVMPDKLDRQSVV